MAEPETNQATTRLWLSRPDPGNQQATDALWQIYSDSRTWAHLPAACPTDRAYMEEVIDSHVKSWRDHGLGWWVMYLRDNCASATAGTVVGLGGVAWGRTVEPVWNLGYRLAPSVWGLGLATELAEAGLTNAAQVRHNIPVTARALKNNPASCRVLEKAGLKCLWQGTAAADDKLTCGLMRRVYADRPLNDNLLNQLIALG